jgi:hypothetical protein
MESLASTYNTKITIASRGGVGTDNLVTTLDEFKKDADDFVKSLDALDDPTDYTKAAFLAKLEPYEQTTDLMVGGDVELQQDVLAEYIDLAEVYDTVQAEVELAKSHPEKYDHGESLLPVFTNKITTIKKNRTKLKSAAKNCARTNPNTRICLLPEELNLADEEALRSDLPVEKEVYPKTCAERREAYSQSNTDRVYTLYLGADKNKPYLVYCQDQGKADVTPQEYLELVNTSPKSDHPSFNYTKHINVMKSDSDQRTTMTSVFTKLKVLVNNDHLTILPGQTLYVESDGGPTKTGVGLNGYDLNQFATFGEPYVCDTTQATTAFNINLEGTPWKIAEGVKWVTPGKGVTYELEPKSLTWTDARANAMQKGGHLVTIDNAAENETIVAKFKSIANNSWIGFFIAKSVWSANDFR